MFKPQTNTLLPIFPQILQKIICSKGNEMRESVKVKNLGKCWWREVWFGGCVPRRADDDDEKLGGWRGSVYLGGLRRAIDNWIPGNDGRDGRPTDKIGIKPIQPTTSQLQKSHQQVFKAYTFLIYLAHPGTWTEGSKYCSCGLLLVQTLLWRECG